MTYFGLQVASIWVLWGLSISLMGTWAFLGIVAADHASGPLEGAYKGPI